MKIIAKWQEAENAAEKIGKADVLYCLKFSHGLMKVGRTSNLSARLNSLSSHGLLKPLLEEMLIEPVYGDIANAEKLMLRELERESKKVEKEVFQVIGSCKIKMIMQRSSAGARPKKEKPTKWDFDAIAHSSGMYAAFLPLAIEKAKKMGMHERAAELQAVLDSAPPGKLNDIVRNSLSRNPRAA